MKPKIGIRVLIAALFVSSVALAQAEQIGVKQPAYEGGVVTTSRTGVSSKQIRMELKGPKGIKSIEWNEHSDKPCQIDVTGRNFNNPAKSETLNARTYARVSPSRTRASGSGTRIAREIMFQACGYA